MLTFLHLFKSPHHLTCVYAHLKFLYLSPPPYVGLHVFDLSPLIPTTLCMFTHAYAHLTFLHLSHHLMCIYMRLTFLHLSSPPYTHLHAFTYTYVCLTFLHLSLPPYTHLHVLDLSALIPTTLCTFTCT